MSLSRSFPNVRRPSSVQLVYVGVVSFYEAVVPSSIRMLHTQLFCKTPRSDSLRENILALHTLLAELGRTAWPHTPLCKIVNCSHFIKMVSGYLGVEPTGLRSGETEVIFRSSSVTHTAGGACFSLLSICSGFTHTASSIVIYQEFLDGQTELVGYASTCWGGQDWEHYMLDIAASDPDSNTYKVTGLHSSLSFASALELPLDNVIPWHITIATRKKKWMHGQWYRFGFCFHFHFFLPDPHHCSGLWWIWCCGRRSADVCNWRLLWNKWATQTIILPHQTSWTYRGNPSSEVFSVAYWGAQFELIHVCLWTGHTGCLLVSALPGGRYEASDRNSHMGFITFCTGLGSCKPHDFRCTSGDCIPLEQQCNGYQNCEDGSDESDWACTGCPIGK